jgi:hypothetical protein
MECSGRRKATIHNRLFYLNSILHVAWNWSIGSKDGVGWMMFVYKLGRERYLYSIEWIRDPCLANSAFFEVCVSHVRGS